jgi:Uri superfamily endonuclease
MAIRQRSITQHQAIISKIDNCHGTYALIYRCATAVEVVVGKLGPVFLPSGYWIYVGSAFGPGGLRSRLTHHLRVSHHPHWHLDYIKSALNPFEIWTTIDAVKREHDWAKAFSSLKGASRPVYGFGASDCACRSHLIHMPRRPRFADFKQRIRAGIPEHSPLNRVHRSDRLVPGFNG